jgi:hypothetical protein
MQNKMITRYLEFILETSKYKSIDSDNFVKFFNKIVTHFKETNSKIINDFKVKLFEYVSQDQSSLYPINFFDKGYKKLIDIIHVLDNKNAEIILHKNKKSTIDVSLPDLKPVWKDDEKKIYVYRADTIFQAIALGKGTNFCISSDYKNGENYFHEYMYDSDGDGDVTYFIYQKASIYFIKSPNQKPEYQTLAIDVRRDGSFLYTDVRNNDEEYESYKEMISSSVSPALKYIPKSVFKFVKTTPTEEEIEIYKNEWEFTLVLINRDPDDLLRIVRKMKITEDGIYHLIKSCNEGINGAINNDDRIPKNFFKILIVLLSEISSTSIYPMLLYLLYNSEIFKKIFNTLERKYKIFLIVMISCYHLNRNEIEEIILGNFKDKDGSFIYHLREYGSFISSLDDIKVSEIEDILASIEMPPTRKVIGYTDFDEKIQNILSMVRKYGESIFKVIYYGKKKKRKS